LPINRLSGEPEVAQDKYKECHLEIDPNQAVWIAQLHRLE